MLHAGRCAPYGGIASGHRESDRGGVVVVRPTTETDDKCGGQILSMTFKAGIASEKRGSQMLQIKGRKGMWEGDKTQFLNTACIASTTQGRFIAHPHRRAPAQTLFRSQK